jgi:5-methylcytosine-specific restriction enzyme subunit McrC
MKLTPKLPAPDVSGSAPSPIFIELTEWDQTGPSRDPRLRGRSLAADLDARKLAELLCEKIDVREGYDGLEVSTTSFVGRIDLGPLRITILPKLPAAPLAQLLRYAYGLRDLTLLAETQSATEPHRLHDILIAMLLAEVDELVHRGLPRQYVGVTNDLSSPRGQILVDQIVRNGGLRDASLPCRHFDRRLNWHLNQVLLAGLELAAGLAEDRDLRRTVHQLAAKLGDVAPLQHFGPGHVDRAFRGLTRLTSAAAPALTLIRLLLMPHGTDLTSSDHSWKIPGFLFDMNVFFQRLLSRFLQENLTETHVIDEFAISDMFAFSTGLNPRRRTTPRPRPDYALVHGNMLSGFLDAKYRDLWERSLPAEWLYQLSIYALASPAEASVLLYATMSDEATDEQIEIRRSALRVGGRTARVVVRPVSLVRLASLVDPTSADSVGSERKQYATALTAFDPNRVIAPSVGRKLRA